MTSDLFEVEMRPLEWQLQLRKRKILLLVDDCPAYPVLEKLDNIKLVFLPGRTKSILRPLDQGVTGSLRCQYCKLILSRMIECIEKK
jgi:hypothetical protein